MVSPVKSILSSTAILWGFVLLANSAMAQESVIPIQASPSNSKVGRTYFIEPGCDSKVSFSTKDDLSRYKKLMNLGQLLYFNGNIDRAISAFKRASIAKPDAFEPHLNLVNIYVQKQDFPSAVAECREGIKIKSNHRDLHLILGNQLRTMAAGKDPEVQQKLLLEALDELIIAEAWGASKALVRSTKGVIYVQTGEFDKAMEQLEAALEENYTMPDAHLIKAVLHHNKSGEANLTDAQRQEHKDLTMKHLDLAIKLKGKNAEARYTKADILYSRGRIDEALEEYKLALRDDENYIQALMGMANILIEQQKPDEALKYLMKAEELNPAPSTKTKIEIHIRLLQRDRLLTPGGLKFAPGQS